jgi:hypothetical protein
LLKVAKRINELTGGPDQLRRDPQMRSHKNSCSL